MVTDSLSNKEVIYDIVLTINPSGDWGHTIALEKDFNDLSEVKEKF